MLKVFATWVRDLALLAESVAAVRPPSAQADWRPGAIVRLPFSKRICSNGSAVCSQALMAPADTAMVIACSAARHHRPDHALPAAGQFRHRRQCPSDADRLQTSFGRVMLLGAHDRRPVGMVASAYSMM